MSSDDFAESLRRMVQGAQDADLSASQNYQALKATRQLAAHRVLTYRCAAERCLLLDFVQILDDLVVHQPSYKHSAERYLAQSSESGRARRSDGKGRWHAHTYVAREVANYSMQCDHLNMPLTESDRSTDLAKGWRVVLVTSGGDRYC